MVILRVLFCLTLHLNGNHRDESTKHKTISKTKGIYYVCRLTVQYALHKDELKANKKAPNKYTKMSSVLFQGSI